MNPSYVYLRKVSRQMPSISHVSAMEYLPMGWTLGGKLPSLMHETLSGIYLKAIAKRFNR